MSSIIEIKGTRKIVEVKTFNKNVKRSEIVWEQDNRNSTSSNIQFNRRKNEYNGFKHANKI